MAGSRRAVVPVHIHGPDGLTHVFAPGDEVPADLAARVRNPDVWGSDAPESAPAPSTPAVSEPEALSADGDDDDEQPAGSDIPPKSGPEGSRAAWAEYADSVGVMVTSIMKRNDIIAAVEQAGKPTE